MNTIDMNIWMEIVTFLAIGICALPFHYRAKKITKIIQGKMVVGDIDLSKGKYQFAMLAVAIIGTINTLVFFNISTVLTVLLVLQSVAWLLQVPSSIILYKELVKAGKQNTGNFNINMPVL